MQKWEYCYVYRERKYETSIIGSSRFEPWRNSIHTSTGSINSDESLIKIFTKLGDEGWELVSHSPRSQVAFDRWSGFDDQELWTFKRPKS